jgi:hypothetical protein
MPLTPDEVSGVLGISATRSRPINPDSKYRHEREGHYWGWSSNSHVQSVDGIDHVRSVVSLLQGKEKQLEQLRQSGCTTDVCCYWFSSGQGGPFLDSAALADLARLGLEIWWDVYFGKEEEYVEGAAGSTAGGA